MKLRIIQTLPDETRLLPAPGWLPGRDEVWIWCVLLPLGRPAPECWRGGLSPTEVERLERFRRDEDRERFLVGRGLLRLILGVCVGLPPAKVPLRHGPCGKPALSDVLARRTGVRFNVSHSGRVVLLGLTCAGEIGIDVETAVLPDDWRDVANRFYSVRERAELASLLPGQQTAAFFNCWTRKEAWCKATGEGLTANPAAAEVTLLPGLAPRLLSIAGRPTDPDQWLLHDVRVPEGYAGAVAVWVNQPAPKHWARSDR